MIITPIDEMEAWTCLARRGMLFSETESVDFWRFEVGDGIEFGACHGIDELIVVLAGSIEIAGRTLDAGMLAFISDGTDATLKAHKRAEILTVRVVPDQLTMLMPPRIPELPKYERSI